jgi:hypothetical protein
LVGTTVGLLPPGDGGGDLYSYQNNGGRLRVEVVSMAGGFWTCEVEGKHGGSDDDDGDPEGWEVGETLACDWH